MKNEAVDKLVATLGQQSQLFEILEQLGGEITPDMERAIEAYAERSLQEVDKCALTLDELEVRAEMIKKERDRLDGMIKTCLNVRELIITRLKGVMVSKGLKEVSGVRSEIKLNGAANTLELDDSFVLPDQYARIKKEPDKVAIKKALESFIDIPGAKLKKNYSLKIKTKIGGTK